MAEKQHLAEALRAEILKLATDGDPKGEGALTADVLLRIMRVAKTGRDLLVSLNASSSNLASMLKRPKPGYIPFLGENMDDGGLVDGYVENSSPFAMSSPAENFGMIAMRELVAAAKNLNGGASPEKLVEALVIAREKGLHDVAQKLEEQLSVRIGKSAVEKTRDLEGKEPE